MSERLDTIQRYLSDMLTVVRHVQEAVDRQKTDSRVVRMEDARALLQKTSLALNVHSGELRRLIAERGDGNGSEGVVDTATSTMKEVVASTLGQAAGIIGMVRPDKVSLMLRDDYTALNMTAIAYTMLHTTALVLHDETVASMAYSHLHDITPLIIGVNEVIPRVVAMELMDEAEQVDLSLVNQAISNTQNAWEQDHVHTGHVHSWETDLPSQQQGSSGMQGQQHEAGSMHSERWESGSPPAGTDWEASTLPGEGNDPTTPPDNPDSGI